MWKSGTVTSALPGIASSSVQLFRGPQQGAPESPLLFTCIVDHLLSDKWSSLGDRGWTTDQPLLYTICNADGIRVVADSLKSHEAMIAEHTGRP